MASLDAAQAQASELCAGKHKAVPLSAIEKAKEELRELPDISLLEDSCEGLCSDLHLLWPSLELLIIIVSSPPSSWQLANGAIGIDCYKDTCQYGMCFATGESAWNVLVQREDATSWSQIPVMLQMAYSHLTRGASHCKSMPWA